MPLKDPLFFVNVGDFALPGVCEPLYKHFFAYITRKQAVRTGLVFATTKASKDLLPPPVASSFIKGAHRDFRDYNGRSELKSSWESNHWFGIKGIGRGGVGVGGVGCPSSSNVVVPSPLMVPGAPCPRKR